MNKRLGLEIFKVLFCPCLESTLHKKMQYNLNVLLLKELHDHQIMLFFCVSIYVKIIRELLYAK